MQNRQSILGRNLDESLLPGDSHPEDECEGPAAPEDDSQKRTQFGVGPNKTQALRGFESTQRACAVKVFSEEPVPPSQTKPAPLAAANRIRGATSTEYFRKKPIWLQPEQNDLVPLGPPCSGEHAATLFGRTQSGDRSDKTKMFFLLTDIRPGRVFRKKQSGIEAEQNKIDMAFQPPGRTAVVFEERGNHAQLGAKCLWKDPTPAHELGKVA
jgi:hypothetical protein